MILGNKIILEERIAYQPPCYNADRFYSGAVPHVYQLVAPDLSFGFEVLFN